jgi:hypothetical protein
MSATRGHEDRVFVIAYHLSITTHSVKLAGKFMSYKFYGPHLQRKLSSLLDSTPS